MTQAEQPLLLLILIVGAILVAAMLLKAGLERIGVPALVGYVILGLVVNAVEEKWQIFSVAELEVFEFLADIGIICLLFRVGLESKLSELIGQLRRASVVWLGNVLASGLLGFFTASSVLNLETIPSLFVGTAMTATSVGISVSIWREADALNSPNGELMLDVAEMDDLSAVILMALLFAIAPVLRDRPIDVALLAIVLKTATLFCLNALVFGTFCVLFSRYGEGHLTSFFQRLEPSPDPTITVAGVGFIIASFAGLLGFSVAIGAFFAGLVFCRDPDAIKIDASFDTFYELFVPFFFVHIGLKIDFQAFSAGLDLGIILLVAAVAGKLIGVAIPVLKVADRKSAILLGISMVPRAEIVMIVMQHGLVLGDWAIPDRVFAAMVLVCVATTIIVPPLLRPLLSHWPQR